MTKLLLLHIKTHSTINYMDESYLWQHTYFFYKKENKPQLLTNLSLHTIRQENIISQLLPSLLLRVWATAEQLKIGIEAEQLLSAVVTTNFR